MAPGYKLERVVAQKIQESKEETVLYGCLRGEEDDKLDHLLGPPSPPHPGGPPLAPGKRAVLLGQQDQEHPEELGVGQAHLLQWAALHTPGLLEREPDVGATPCVLSSCGAMGAGPGAPTLTQESTCTG